MNLEEFIGQMEVAAGRFSLFLEIIHQTDHSIKARIAILEDICIQFYFHERSGTTNFVLICWSNRLFARDCIHGSWHMHPFDNPEYHDSSEIGLIKPTPESFLEEVFEWLVKKGIL